jgi:aryl carrier-like protein
VLPEIAVGAGATVGAGSTVVSEVPAGATVMGVPARVLVRGTDVEATPATGSRRVDLDADALEAALVAAWTEVLEGVAVTPASHVFELGATSLAALRVAERMGREGVALEVVDLFRFPTIRDLARHLARPTGPRDTPRAAPPLSPRPPKPSGPPATEVSAPPTGEALVATIVEVFREVLDAPAAGPGSHFFDLGGDPVRAQEACRTLQRITGEPLCFMQVARYPTPSELARHLEATVGHPPNCPAQGVMTRLIHRHEWHRG